MVVGWEWDESLFAGAAAYYRRGRLPYAPGWVEVLAEELGLDGRGRLLDVGCGPGTLALPLAHWFGEVVGVDPDRGMIAEAERAAGELGVASRARWVRARAEELPAGLGTFGVVAFGQSFHWVERERVAATVMGMLRPGGTLVHVSDLKENENEKAEGLGEYGAGTPAHSAPEVSAARYRADPVPEAMSTRCRADSAPEVTSTRRLTPPAPTDSPPDELPYLADELPYPAVPYEAIGEVVRRYLGPVRRAGRGVLPRGTPGGEAEVFARAGFAGPRRCVVPGGQVLVRSVDEVVAWTFSMSFSAPHLFGAELPAFEEELRRLLYEASPVGRFSARQPGTEVFLWRKDRSAVDPGGPTG
ncbi:class I SAM-dependent methyltransferase [Streptomyces physcomitrii]|uniref:class I SAM-dependent methyltransferase n=1 Tax=Streptomyces physcomitrii TaxID=2724184 RepID=UPI001FE33AEB|nr:class I SAM-dependent methyltransferase [Streptomyces physcomitrii]